MAKKTRVAINGFGRIGRSAFKIMLESPARYQVVAINDLAPAENLAYLLKYDTVYGRYDKKVGSAGSNIVVSGRKYAVTAVPDPLKLPWKKMRIDVVLECTGLFVKDNKAAAHIKAGAKHVIVSAPVKGGDIATYLLGVNERKLKNDKVISNASCTTNCIAPVAKVMVDKFGVDKAMMTTIHSYTADQRLVDAPHKDARRGRSAAQNIVPTTTGAASALGAVIPELQGLFDGLSLRVPTAVVSLADFTFLLKKKVTVRQVNNALISASNSQAMKGILGVTNDAVVSSDFIGDARSSIVDLSLTNVVGGNLVKIIAWYDNEWGYANRLVEMIREFD
ncbi:MAG: type I glyceraldehyde-3-phosphate dehydrogenase [Parcubacteria group bacterium]|nr:MAG: type I glyceraldehyde-3-phosphate dehydrogenase [Parcubacteria group bacterium]